MKELHIDKIDCIVTDSKSAFVKHRSDVKKAIIEFENNLNDTFLKYKDFLCDTDKDDMIFSSELRGVAFIMKNCLFKYRNISHEEASNDYAYIKSVISRADEYYDIDSSEAVDSDLYLSILKKVLELDMIEEHEQQMKTAKRDAKRHGKKIARFRYRIGDRYSIIKKTPDGNKILSEVFEVKKFIYSIGNNVVNSVVMKQISGDQYRTRTLNEYDCKAFHLKYEPGLYIFSMNASLYKLDNDNEKKDIKTV